MRAGLLEAEDPARLLGPRVRGAVRVATLPAGCRGTFARGSPCSHRRGVPGSSVRAPSDENATGSSTLDPSLPTDTKLGFFLILMTFTGEKAAQHSYVIPSHSKDLGRAWASHEAA